MVKSMYSGVSGLKTHQAKMDVVGNNIANVNTVGFKAGVVTFRDVYYQFKINPAAGTATTGGVNPAQVGYGVRLNSTIANMTQSGYNQSDWWADVAIDGEGFFQVMDGTGKIFYTRAGKFVVDADGYLVNASGFHVLGVTGNSQGVQPSQEIIRIVVPETNPHASSATKKVNGTNVTLSVSAPSDKTNMSVTFTEAKFPYATYSNNILNIFFNSDEQYGSQEDFEAAIGTALQAGGVTLPDDVTLQFAFETIPDDYAARAASNTVEDFRVSTEKAAYQYHTTYTEAGLLKHAYMTFSVKDPTCQDKINVKVADRVTGNEVINADYDNGLWTLTIYKDSTAAEINTAIKKKIEQLEQNGITVSKINCDTMVLPGGAAREDVLKNMVMTSDGATPPTYAEKTVQLVGGSKNSVALSLRVQEEGEFANHYKVVFNYKAGYGKTNAVWDENVLNITIGNDTTISEVNKAIKEVAGGDAKKIIMFNEISGLDYGEPVVSVAPNAAGSGYVVTQTDVAGNTRYQEVISANPLTQAQISALTWPGTGANDGFTNADGSTAASNFLVAKPAADVWQPVFREAFFSGNPAITPADGKDSFFTETAKALSTFALVDGRTGGPQSYGDLTDISIQADGTIIGLHAVHGYITLGRIDIVTFDNSSGLSQAGGTNFAETVASGAPKLKIASTEGSGSILSGTLEMSNVDLSQEFTDMITTQRGFQANSRVITVSDTMLEELLSLKR